MSTPTPSHSAHVSTASSAAGGAWPLGHGTPRMSVDDDRSSGAFSPQQYADGSKHKFKTYRLRGEKMEKPWLTDPAMKRTRWNNLIVGTWILLGFLGSGGVAFWMVWPYRSIDVSTPVPCHIGRADGFQMCLVYEDSFETFNRDVWTHEVQLDGYGTGSFDWTTTDETNSYVDASGLHIVPTLTNETTSITNDELFSDYTLNLERDGTCTGEKNTSCIITSDPEEGTMIPPVRSARLSTKGAKSIRYGKVEVVAKLPKGDWLWPAIWMMPEDSVYGDWPRSGEIDIMESRGNGRSYDEGGLDHYYGSMHWGPTADTDAYYKTTSAKKIRRGDFSDGFHTFGIQWTPSYIYFYVDSRIHQILFIDFKGSRPLYELGGFEGTYENETLLANPWAGSNSTTGSAPFDQKFYLILNVAVGSQNGWFLDSVDNKPWLDRATNAQWTFWSNADEWLPTWGDGDERGMTVKSVKMWELGKCGGMVEL